MQKWKPNIFYWINPLRQSAPSSNDLAATIPAANPTNDDSNTAVARNPTEPGNSNPSADYVICFERVVLIDFSYM